MHSGLRDVIGRLRTPITILRLFILKSKLNKFSLKTTPLSPSAKAKIQDKKEG
jgi:hypothetical protein